MWVHFVFLSLYLPIFLPKVNWYMILELWYNWLFSVIPINFNGSLFYCYWWCFLVFFPTFLLFLTLHPQGEQGSFIQPHFFFSTWNSTFSSLFPIPQWFAVSALWCLISDCWGGVAGKTRTSDSGAHFVTISYRTVFTSSPEAYKRWSPCAQSLCRRRGWLYLGSLEVQKE